MKRIKAFLAEFGWALVYLLEDVLRIIRADWKSLLALSAGYIVCVIVVAVLWPKV